MTAPSLPAAPPVDREIHDDRHRATRDRLVINLLLVSAFVVILNETIMGVALFRLMHDLKIDANAAQWLTTAFMLTMAVVIPVTGFLLQRFHTRPVFVAAMTLFSVGTLVSALAPGFGVLLVGRVIQAGGTAIMMPLLLTTVLTLVAPEARGRTMGKISIVISVAPAIGPTISGLILSVLDWRWMFGLVLPIAVGALVLGALRITNVTTPRRVPIDVASVILSACGFGGLVYGLSSIGEGSGEAGLTRAVVALGAGALALALFVLRQLALQRTDRPLLGPVVGRIYDRFGPGVLLVPGSVIVSAAFWGMTLLGQDTPVGFVLLAHVVLSIGLALLFTPLFTTALGAVKPELYSHGSAIVGTVQQLAGAAGTALFVTIMSVAGAAATSSGGGVVSATAGGIRAAFVCGAVISVFAVVAALFIRTPALGGGEHTGASHTPLA